MPWELAYALLIQLIRVVQSMVPHGTEWSKRQILAILIFINNDFAYQTPRVVQSMAHHGKEWSKSWRYLDVQAGRPHTARRRQMPGGGNPDHVDLELLSLKICYTTRVIKTYGLKFSTHISIVHHISYILYMYILCIIYCTWYTNS